MGHTCWGAMRDPSDITSIQAEILGVIQEAGGATTAEVRSGLSESPQLARTTVATMLARMEQYGWLTRAKSGKEFTYTSAVTRNAMRSAQVKRIIRTLFKHDLPSLVSHALREGDWEEEDLARIEEMVSASRRGKREAKRT